MSTQAIAGITGTLASMAAAFFLWSSPNSSSKTQAVAGLVSVAALSFLAASKSHKNTKRRAQEAYRVCEIAETAPLRTITHVKIPFGHKRTFFTGLVGFSGSSTVFACEMIRSTRSRLVLAMSGVAALSAALYTAAKVSNDCEIEMACQLIGAKIAEMKADLGSSDLTTGQIAIEEGLRPMANAHDLEDLVAQYQLIKRIMEEHRKDRSVTPATTRQIILPTPTSAKLNEQGT